MLLFTTVKERGNSMDNIIKLNNEIQESKENAIMRMMNDVTIYPMLKESEVGISNYTPLPL